MTVHHANTGSSLYLDPARQWHVRLDDGVALDITTTGRARSLVPLNRIGRVISPADAQWQTQALLACLRHGIPVLFNDRHGDPVGWCFGSRRRETTLATLLREGLGQHDWPDHFGDWYRASLRREMLALLRFAQLHCPNLEAGTVRTLACNRIRATTGVAAGPLLRALSRAVAALVAGHLQSSFGNGVLIGHARPGLHWGLVFLRLLEWRMHRAVLELPTGWMQQMPADRLAAQIVETRGEPLHSGLGELLGDLERFLREWLWQPMH